MPGLHSRVPSKLTGSLRGWPAQDTVGPSPQHSWCQTARRLSIAEQVACRLKQAESPFFSLLFLFLNFFFWGGEVLFLSFSPSLFHSPPFLLPFSFFFYFFFSFSFIFLFLSLLFLSSVFLLLLLFLGFVCLVIALVTVFLSSSAVFVSFIYFCFSYLIVVYCDFCGGICFFGVVGLACLLFCNVDMGLALVQQQRLH